MNVVLFDFYITIDRRKYFHPTNEEKKMMINENDLILVNLYEKQKTDTKGKALKLRFVCLFID